MDPLTLDEAKRVVAGARFVVNLKDPNPWDNQAMGKIDRIVDHWSATGYFFESAKYHFTVVLNPKTQQFEIRQGLSIKHKGEHAWWRNTGAIGVSMACMGEDRDRQGRVVRRYPPLRPMVILQAYTNACLAGMFGLKLDGKVLKPEYRYNKRIRNLEATGRMIEVPVLVDHAIEAKRDEYFPDRWDIGDYWDEVYAWSLRFRQWIVAGEIPNLLVGKVV